MPCFHPVPCWWSRIKTTNGKNGVLYGHYHPQRALHPDPLRPDFKVKCRQCVGCRIDKSRDWALRCVHEAQMHLDSTYITLTFSDEALLEREKKYGISPNTLDHSDWQRFYKKLKSHIRRKHGSSYAKKLRFYMCGEYGDETARPHYHACIFGWQFDDKVFYKIHNGNMLYTSETLNKIWGMGYCPIGNVTFQSAAYIARYVMKKRTGKDAPDHYTIYDEDTGAVLEQIQPEYNRMSTGTKETRGLGYSWIKKYYQEVLNNDFIIHDKKKFMVPEYYEKVLYEEFPEEMDDIKEARVLNALKHVDNNTEERLAVRETILNKKIEKLVRPLL